MLIYAMFLLRFKQTCLVLGALPHAFSVPRRNAPSTVIATLLAQSLVNELPHSFVLRCGKPLTVNLPLGNNYQ